MTIYSAEDFQECLPVFAEEQSIVSVGSFPRMDSPGSSSADDSGALSCLEALKVYVGEEIGLKIHWDADLILAGPSFVELAGSD